MAQFPLMSNLRTRFSPVSNFASSTWSRYRGLSTWLQVAIGIVILIVLGGLYALTHKSSAVNDETTLPTVSIARVDSLSGTGSSIAVIGAVRSITEASILAQSGGTITALHTRLGASVPAGFIIAELENASQRAAVLQAQGSYEAALAARSGVSPSDIAATARNTYTTAYSTLDTLLKSDIDTFFGAVGGQGPQFLINPSPFDFSYFPLKRRSLTDAMNEWRDHVANASSQDPQTLLDEADRLTREVTALANDIAQAATKNDTSATAAQLTALAAARAGLTNIQSQVTAAKASYQGQSTSATAGADASIKIALGSLRGAQAQLEKTFVRAPIGGTINFLPIHMGDYVAAMTHVATVAQNGTLEIVAYVSEGTRALLSVGTKVMVEDSYPAIITSIAPALDPVTKQIEVHIALTEKSPLINGQSVRIALPGSTPITTTSKGPLLLPLTALKLTPAARVVFSVGADGRLVANPVEIGDVHGDRIEITSPLSGDLEIVTDARGFSEGQKVTVATL